MGPSVALRCREALAAPGRLERARPLAWYGASRFLVVVVAWIAVATRPGLSASRLISAWDASYFLTLIKHGYPAAVPMVDGHAAASPLAFFPLFPLAARAVALILHVPPAAAAIAVSLAFGALATVLVRQLARLLTDDVTADRATLLFCFFPGSAVFSIGYSESLMIALAAACLIALLRERWLLAGVMASLATATRPNALALVLACLFASAVAILRRRDWRSLTAPLLAPVGMAAFFAYLRLHTGESGVWFRVQHEGWRQSFDFGVNTLKVLWNTIVDPFGDPRTLLSVILLGFAVAACGVFLSRRWPGVVTIYTLTVVVLAVGSRIDIARPRALLTAFPLFIAMASGARWGEWASTVAVFTIALVAVVAFPFFASP